MTRLFVLGFLNVHPMSGYDIQQVLQMSDVERWGGVLIGSIYHALKKLEQEKLIEVDSIEHTGHRQKAIYRITPQGREHFLQLLEQSLEKSSVIYPSSLYAALSFVDKLPKEQVVASLEKQYIHLENEYTTLQKGMEEKQQALGGDMPAITKLVFDNMFATIREQQKFIKQVIDTME